MAEKVKRTERGWAGHFCCSQSCLFRRNTLIEYKDKKWVISTVGNFRPPNSRYERGAETIGFERYYETMAFDAIYKKVIGKQILQNRSTLIVIGAYLPNHGNNF